MVAKIVQTQPGQAGAQGWKNHPFWECVEKRTARMTFFGRQLNPPTCCCDEQTACPNRIQGPRGATEYCNATLRMERENAGQTEEIYQFAAQAATRVQERLERERGRA